MRHFGILCFFLTVGSYSVSSYDCDVHYAQICKESMIDYEGIQFPFYGGTEQELEESCKGMNSTFECVKDFVSNCEGDKDCRKDSTCAGLVAELSSMWEHTGLLTFHDRLCDPTQHFRKTYLEHYECLVNAAEDYAHCYNKSLDSQEHLALFYTDDDERHDATCCFFSWYQTCYTNATMNTCGSNATFVVSFALHILVGDIASRLCNPLPYCDMPPLPDPKDNEIDSGPTNSVDNPTSTTSRVYVADIMVILVITVLASIFAKTA